MKLRRTRVIHIMWLNCVPLCYLTLWTFNPEKWPFTCFRTSERTRGWGVSYPMWHIDKKCVNIEQVSLKITSDIRSDCWANGHLTTNCKDWAPIVSKCLIKLQMSPKLKEPAPKSGICGWFVTREPKIAIGNRARLTSEIKLLLNCRNVFMK